MTTEAEKISPIPSVRRLPMYLRLLKTLEVRGRDVVSCTHIARELGLVESQVRKDLAMTGIVGKPKVGYHIQPLIDSIEEFLGWKNSRDAFVVGAGSLGTALMGYEGFKEYGLNLLAAFDTDPEKIGRSIHGREVFALEKLPDLARRMHVMIAVLAVPAKVAQDVTTLLVLSGIRAIWNYAPVNLEVPESVIVENMNLSASLAVLSSRLAHALKRQGPATTEELP
jgi:redox-sensing transcriptional repressor